MRKYLPMVDLTRNWHAVNIRNWKAKPREAKNPVLKWAKEQSGSQMWCLMPAIPSLRRQRQEDPKFKAIWTLQWVPDPPQSLGETVSKTKGETQNRASTIDPTVCLCEKFQGLGLDPLHHKKKKKGKTKKKKERKENQAHKQFSKYKHSQQINETHFILPVIGKIKKTMKYHPTPIQMAFIQKEEEEEERLGSGLGQEWQMLARMWRSGVHIQVMRLIQHYGKHWKSSKNTFINK